MKDTLFIITMAVALLFGGCTETKRPVWGKGELPADYQTTFGNTNPSRLNYVQQLQIDKHAKVIAELARRVIAIEAVDPNEVDKISDIRRIQWPPADRKQEQYEFNREIAEKVNEIIDKINPEVAK